MLARRRQFTSLLGGAAASWPSRVLINAQIAAPRFGAGVHPLERSQSAGTIRLV
jgi:hypothetical protein